MATEAKIDVKDSNPVTAVQEFLGKVLADEEIEAILAPRHLPSKGSIMPTLITDRAKLDRADPLAPSFPLNAARMVAKLTRGHTGEGKVAAVLRPCEIRAFVELVKLNQGSMDNIILIAADCYGAFTNTDYHVFMKENGETDPISMSVKFIETVRSGGSEDAGLAKACLACEFPTTRNADLSIGLFGIDTNQEIILLSNTPRGEGLLSRLELDETPNAPARESSLQSVVEKRKSFRDTMFAETTEATNGLEKLSNYLSNCVNCYNCRVACPVCYCKECVFVTDVFDHKPWQYQGWAKQKGALKMPTDTVFFHMTRLAHMSAACVGCGQCSNACPNDVPVMELFRTVADGVQKSFKYEAGKNPDEPPPLAVFHEKEFTEVTGGGH